MKKTVLCIFAALLALISCNSVGPETKSSDTEPARSTEATAGTAEETDAEACPIDLTGTDFSGETLTMGTLDDSANGIDYTIGIYIDEDSGNNLDSAVFARNLWIEENLNCKLALHTLTGTSRGQLPNDILAGDCDIQLLYQEMMSMGGYLTKGLLRDMNTVSPIDWDAVWWNDMASGTTEIAGKRFFTMSDTDYHSFYGFSMIAFNKVLEEQLIESSQSEPFYAIVDAGGWTYDTLYALGEAVMLDLDGNGSFSFGKDRYGVGADSTNASLLILSSGARFTRTDADGNLQNAIGEALFEDTFSKILTLYTTPNLNANPNTLQAPDGYSAWKYYLRLPLAENRCLFNIATFATHSFLREEMEESTYGFLPCPKLSEAQDRYYTPVSYWNGTFIGIPISASNLDFVGTVLNAMEYKSEDTVVPAFYNVALSYKYATDADSIRMLEIIRDGAVVDIGVAFNIGKIQDKLTENVQNGQNTFASSYASREKSVLKDIETIMDAVRYAQ